MPRESMGVQLGFPPLLDLAPVFTMFQKTSAISATLFMLAIMPTLLVPASADPVDDLGDLCQETYGPDPGVVPPDPGTILPNTGLEVPTNACRAAIPLVWEELVPGQIVQVGILEPIDWDLDTFRCYYPYDLQVITHIPEIIGARIQLGIAFKTAEDFLHDDVGIVIPDDTGLDCAIVVSHKWTDEIAVPTGSQPYATGSIANAAGGGWGNPEYQHAGSPWAFKHWHRFDYETYATDGLPQTYAANEELECKSGPLHRRDCWWTRSVHDDNEYGFAAVASKGWYEGEVLIPICGSYFTCFLKMIKYLTLDTVEIKLDSVVQVWESGFVDKSCTSTFELTKGNAPPWLWSTCGHSNFEGMDPPPGTW